jgi:hypothetical protein
VRDRVYETSGPLPRVQLVPHEHVCPDGTRVAVTAQHIATTGVTLYRWRIGGEPAGCTSVVGPATVSPDWSTVDSEHPITLGSLV